MLNSLGRVNQTAGRRHEVATLNQKLEFALEDIERFVFVGMSVRRSAVSWRNSNFKRGIRSARLFTRRFNR